ncbi:hypothetical protein [Sphingobacterium anhuiense]|uniref:hypothetical protein n=1 Tax=Sphingobacterium anhuiense TaxID=493780 RepID=UPI003C2F1D81
MFKSVFEKIGKILSSNFLFDKSIKLLYVILSLYLGANFLNDEDFILLQQINLFQSFLIFSISIPVNAILIRIGNASLTYFNTIIPGVVLYRFSIGILSLVLLYIYFLTANIDHFSTIIVGIIPTFISCVFFVDILPHVFNFEGKKNWNLICIYGLLFIFKCLSIILLKSLHVKIGVEIFEIAVSSIWIYYTYLKKVLSLSYIRIFNSRVIKLIKSSFGLFLNGIFSVFILRIDQFSLINLVDKRALSSYMLIVSISSLFLTPMTLLSERAGFTMSMAKSRSLKEFSLISKKSLYSFLFLSIILYIVFCILINPLAIFVFKRNIHEFYLIAVILGTSIISNSIGMVFGQINSISNGGMYTMKRTLIGCIILFIGVRVGFHFYGIIGVALASAFSLFFTNVIFWFFSKKIKRVVFFDVQK